MELTPDPSNQMYGRGGFFIHADNPNKPPQSSSEGCIVTGPDIRTQIAADPDELLTVTI
jgi:hypothetical protein